MAVFLLQFNRCAVLTFCREDVWTLGIVADWKSGITS